MFPKQGHRGIRVNAFEEQVILPCSQGQEISGHGGQSINPADRHHIGLGIDLQDFVDQRPRYRKLFVCGSIDDGWIRNRPGDDDFERRRDTTVVVQAGPLPGVNPAEARRVGIH